MSVANRPDYLWYQRRFNVALAPNMIARDFITADGRRLVDDRVIRGELLAGSTAFAWYDPSDVANTNWRRNLLTWTEQFDNAAWSLQSTTISANAGAAPDGTQTADDATSTGTDLVSQAVTVASGATVTFSQYFRRGNHDWVRMTLLNGANEVRAWFNIATGAVGTVNVAGTGVSGGALIVDVGNGWYRCILTGSVPSATSYVCVSASTTGDGIFTRVASGVRRMWGAQLEVGSVATEYQRITDVNTEVIQRFPTATLYQDAAGTTPVTAPAQPVGLVLDKSQGLVLGPELVTNGDFSSGTGWTLGSGWSISGGTLNATAAASTVDATQTINTTAGTSYRVTYTLLNYSAGGVAVFVGGTVGQVRNANGTYSEVIVASVGGVTPLRIRTSGTSTYSIDNISVRELPGFHATQSTAANRPTYGVVPSRGRVNLLTFTEQFDNAVWVKTAIGTATAPAVTANAAVAPDGTSTADLVVFNRGAGTSSDRSVLSQAPSLSAGTYTQSVWLKAATAGDVGKQLALRNVAGATYLVVTLTDAWVRYEKAEAWASNNFEIANRQGVTADITVSAHIWGAQLELGSTASPYQRVASQFEVTDPAGFPSYPLHYLFFGGDLDPRWLQTSTITPNADKVQVFAGVRKLSDVSYQTLVESGASVASVNGTFGILSTSGAGTAVANSINFGLRGTATAAYDARSYAANANYVLSGALDISGASIATEIFPRVNGAVPSTLASVSGADAGTGSFTAQPLFIGRRNGASLAFNGQLYGLLVRFSTANLDASVISQTERWMGQKTGVTI